MKSSEEIGMNNGHPESGIVVVKLGGSLADTVFLQNWLEVLAEPRRNSIVLVPGGGGFADQVRVAQIKWNFDDRTAHCMALLAMQQYGLMLASFSPRFAVVRPVGEICGYLARRRVAVWMPDVDELDRAGVPSSWRITSDSLSAWLAGRISAQRLVLVKSAERPKFSSEPEELAREGIVDSAFPKYLEKSGVSLKIFHASEYRQFVIELDRPLLPTGIPRAATSSA